MGVQTFPPPAADDAKWSSVTPSRKSSSTVSSKSAKSANRISKRAGSNTGSHHHDHHLVQAAGMDGRHKRVWKACERCRMKKTKVRHAAVHQCWCIV
jgi:ABC-type protease/lipase transport system fused ATPase/permease subunit